MLNLGKLVGRKRGGLWIALVAAVMFVGSCGSMPHSSMKVNTVGGKKPAKVPADIVPEILSGLAGYFQAGDVPSMRIGHRILESGDRFSLANAATGGSLISEMVFAGEGTYDGVVVGYDPVREEWVFFLPPSLFEAKGLVAFSGDGLNRLQLTVSSGGGASVLTAEVTLYAFTAMGPMGAGFEDTNTPAAKNAEGYSMEGWVNLTERPVAFGVATDKTQSYLISGVGMMLHR